MFIPILLKIFRFPSPTTPSSLTTTIRISSSLLKNKYSLLLWRYNFVLTCHFEKNGWEPRKTSVCLMKCKPTMPSGKWNLSPRVRNCGYRSPGNYCLSPRIQGFGIRNPAEIDNGKLMRPVVFLRDQAARSPLQFPPERSLVVESR